jgi:hypothetical protein
VWSWPVSQYLAALLQPQFAKWLPDDLLYSSLFDRFEYLLALLMQEAGHFVPARYIMHVQNDNGTALNPAAWLDRDLERHASGQHPLLAAGGFGGDQQKLLDAKAAVDAFARRSYA